MKVNWFSSWPTQYFAAPVAISRLWCPGPKPRPGSGYGARVALLGQGHFYRTGSYWAARVRGVNQGHNKRSPVLSQGRFLRTGSFGMALLYWKTWDWSTKQMLYFTWEQSFTEVGGQRSEVEPEPQAEGHPGQDHQEEDEGVPENVGNLLCRKLAHFGTTSL